MTFVQYLAPTIYCRVRPRPLREYSSQWCGFFLQDLKGVVRRFADFLGQKMSEETLEQVVSHCTFESMKTNAMSNYSLVPQEVLDSTKSSFLRKGSDRL